MKNTLFSLLLLMTTPFYGTSLDYSLSFMSPNTHTYVIELQTEPQYETYTDFKMPAWRPGRYYLQDYAAAVSHVEAFGTGAQPLKWQKIDKDTWRVSHDKLETVRIKYRFFANNEDAGSSYLSHDQAYFNPVNMFMYVPGRYDTPVTLEVKDLPSHWDAATPLQQGDKYNEWKADSYHEFVDSPTVLAKEIKTLTFEDKGTTFYMHFHGDYQGNKEVDEALKENVKKICQEQSRIFGGKYPFKTYHFIYRLLAYDMRHAVEHSNSASFVLPARVTASVKALSGIYGITAHEFWHAWNVKRIRPAALWPYDYSQPQYTNLHWFTEGVTDYYTLLSLVRTGLSTKENFYRRIARSIESVENSYAASVVSASASSFNSWQASSPYAAPQFRTSYYGLGSRLGLLFDLELRKVSEGTVGLDDIFHYLYITYYEQDQGVPEDGIQLAAEKLTNQSWQAWFDSFVHGTEAYDYKSVFSAFGLDIRTESDDDTGPRRLGIMRTQQTSQGFVVSSLDPRGDAARDGLAQGDLILSIDGQNATGVDLDSYLSDLKKGSKISIKVFSGLGLQDLEITLKGSYQPVVFYIEEKDRQKTKEENMRERWLGN